MLEMPLAEKSLIGNVDKFINIEMRAMEKKLDAKIGQGRLPFDKSKIGVDEAIESVRNTLANPSETTGIIPKESVRGQYDLIHICSSKTGNTVSLRVLENGK